MLKQLTTLLRPAEMPGRMLATSWRNADTAPEIAAIGGTLNCQPFLVSPNQTVTQAAEKVGINAVTGDFPKDTEISHFQFSLVLVLREMLTISQSDDGFPEWHHAREAGPYLRAQGILALVTHRSKLLEHPRALVSLLQAYRELNLFRLEGEALLVAGVRRGTRAQQGLEDFESFTRMLAENQIPSLPGKPLFDLPAIQPNRRLYFRSRHFDPNQMARVAAALPWGEKRLRTAISGWEVPTLSPAMPLRAMHLGAAISSGALGMLRIRSEISGDEYVIQGRTMRRIRKSFSSEEDAVRSAFFGHDSNQRLEEDLQTGDFVTDISLLNLTRAEVHRVDPQSPGEMTAFLQEFGPQLASKAAANYTPLYDPQVLPYPRILVPELVQVIDAPFNWAAARVTNISGTTIPSLTHRQRHFAAAAFLKLLGPDAVRPEYKENFPQASSRLILSGQTAVGKTILSHRLQLGLQILKARFQGRRIGQTGWPLSMFVATPANVPHVLKELRLASPLFDGREVRSRAELLEILDEVPHSPRPIMLVISRTMLRQMQQIIPAYRPGLPQFESAGHGAARPVLRCPTCGERIPLSQKEIQAWPDDSFLTNGGWVRSRGRKCHACGSALYQETHAGSYSLAQTLRRELKKRGIPLLSLVIDELHEDANLTNQGAAMGWIADLAEYVVAASGTVYGGTPQSVFYLLFRLIPEFRESWDFSEVDRFIERYGNWRRQRKKSGRWGSRLALPGISPDLIAGIFLNYATFITQADAGLPMPERCDLPLELAPTEEEREGLRLAANCFKAVVKADGESRTRQLSAIGASAQLLYLAPVGMHLKQLSPFSPAYKCSKCGKRKVGTIDKCQHYWLREEDELERMDPEERAEIEPLVADQVLDPEWRSTKEQGLIELVQREKHEGRTVLVYIFHSGRYAVDSRVEMVLGAAGLSTLNLSSTRIKKLEEAVNAAAFDGIDAVISNPARIGTGLNLTGTPSVCWYQPVWSPKLMIQASARPDRPTQSRPVRVYYPVLNGSAETVVLSRAIEKIISIYMLAGIDTEGMSEVIEAAGHAETFTESMIRYVSSHVETDLSTLFDQLASLDQERTIELDAALFEAQRERLAIEPIDLANVRQLELL